MTKGDKNMGTKGFDSQNSAEGYQQSAINQLPVKGLQTFAEDRRHANM